MKNYIKKVRNFFRLQKSRWCDRKTHIYEKCPHCHAVLRLPKKKGLHGVRCPRCEMHFDINVR